MTLGEIIRQFRQEHDLSQRQFAMRCGLSNGYIAMLEKNMNPKTGRPISVSLENLHDIASAMSMTADELMRMADGNTQVSMEENGKDMGQPPLMPEEAQLLSMTRKMTQEEKQRVLDVMRLMFPEYRDDK